MFLDLLERGLDKKSRLYWLKNTRREKQNKNGVWVKKKQGERRANKQTVKRLHRGLIGHRWKQLKTGETNDEQVDGHKGEEANEAKTLQTRKEKALPKQNRKWEQGKTEINT